MPSPVSYTHLLLAVEMESTALYLNAARAHKRALTLCTISDLIFTGADCSQAVRETGFDQMIQMLSLIHI